MARSPELREADDTFFEEVLRKLASDMRAYDEQHAELQHLSEKRTLHSEVIEAALGDAETVYPLYVAREALSVYIINKRIGEVRGTTNFSYTTARDKLLTLHRIRLRNRPIIIQALGSFPIHEFRKDSKGELQTTDREYTSRTGHLENIGLSPDDGGYLQITGGFLGKVYQARPLVSRINGYEPAFDLTWK